MFLQWVKYIIWNCIKSHYYPRNVIILDITWFDHSDEFFKTMVIQELIKSQVIS